MVAVVGTSSLAFALARASNPVGLEGWLVWTALRPEGSPAAAAGTGLMCAGVGARSLNTARSLNGGRPGRASAAIERASSAGIVRSTMRLRAADSLLPRESRGRRASPKTYLASAGESNLPVTPMIASPTRSWCSGGLGAPAASPPPIRKREGDPSGAPDRKALVLRIASSQGRVEPLLGMSAASE